MKDVTTKDGRVFYWLCNIPYTRLNGTTTELAIWHSACTECGAPFTVSTPLSGKSEAFGRKRCDTHKLTAAQVRDKWVAAVRANRC